MATRQSLNMSDLGGLVAKILKARIVAVAIACGSLCIASVLAEPPAEPCPCDYVNIGVHTLPPGTPPNHCDADWLIEADPLQPLASPVWHGPRRLYDNQYGYDDVGIQGSMCWNGIHAALCPDASRPAPGDGDPGDGDSPDGEVGNALLAISPGEYGDGGSGLIDICSSPKTSRSSSLNVNLLVPPSIGDFAPPSPTLGGSSIPLIIEATSNRETSWAHTARPTIEGKVDLITGVPLAQFVDLELPITGGVYRLTRTRSAATGRTVVNNSTQLDRWWDWAGQGWMVNEQPFLWIDSALPDVVGNNPRTTYLALDAFHSIPFQLIESTGQYEAPARFKAKMTHDGTWDPSTRWWLKADGRIFRPRRYTISLYDGAVTYSFAAIYEDIPGRSVSLPAGFNPIPSMRSLHERPLLGQQFLEFNPAGPTGTTDPWNANNPGVGAPYYGLCTRIESLHGHRVEMEYCPVTQRALDNLASSCVECMGDCGAKGQLRSVTVSAPGEGGVLEQQWKLFYKYRITPKYNNIIDIIYSYYGSYGDGDSTDCGRCSRVCTPEELGRTGPCMSDRVHTQSVVPLCQAEFELLRRSSLRVIDSIFVYDAREGIPYGVEQYNWCEPLHSLDASASYLPASSQAINFTGLWLGDFDSGDQWATSAFMHNVPSGKSAWSHRIRYHYLPIEIGSDSRGGGQELPVPIFDLPKTAMLLKSTVYSRSQDHGYTNRSTMLQYDGLSTTGLSANTSTPEVPLKSIWISADISTTLEAMKSVCDSIQVQDLTWLLMDTSFSGLINCQSSTDINVLKNMLSMGASTHYETGTSGFTNFVAPWGGTPVTSNSTQLDFALLHTRPSGNAYFRSFDAGSQGNAVDSPLRPHYQFGSGTSRSMISTLTSRSTGSDARHYRIFRLIVVPQFYRRESTLYNNMRIQSYFQPAMFFAPYAWWGYTPLDCDSTGGTPASCSESLAMTKAPDYREARWVTIVDEFTDRESMDSSVAYGTIGTPGPGVPAGLSQQDAEYYMIKPGQLSRRVVEISPSGVVLRDRSWHFDLSGVSAPILNVQGLGEEFIYETVGNYFGTTNDTSPPPSGAGEHFENMAGGIYKPASSSPAINEVQWQANGGGYVGPDDPWATTRNDLLLVEHRSIGWSAAALAHAGNSGLPALNDGLTRFFEYALRYYDSTPQADDDQFPTWDAGIVFLPTLVAEGIKRGRVYGVGATATEKLPRANSDEPRLYTKQYLRSPNPGVAASGGWNHDGWSDIETDIVFTKPGISPLPLGSWPEPSAAPSSDFIAVHRLVKRAATATEADPVALPERRVTRTLSVGPAQQLDPSSAWHYPIDGMWHDEEGRTTWSASGLVQNAIAPSSSATNTQSLAWTRYLYDDESRLKHSIVDVGLSAVTLHEDFGTASGTGEIEIEPGNIGTAYPEGWPRLAPDQSPPQNYVTSYLYKYSWNLLCDIFYPNGRRWARRILSIGVRDWMNVDNLQGCGMPGQENALVPLWNTDCFASSTVMDKWFNLENTVETDADYLGDNGFAREYIFENIERTVAGGTWRSESVGSIRDYYGTEPFGNPRVDRKVVFALPVTLGENDFSITAAIASPIDLDTLSFISQPRFTIYRSSMLILDSNGRPVQADFAATGNDGNVVSEGSVEVNDLVDLIREQSVDHTISRSIRDIYGQVIRRYVGTDDTGWGPTTNYNSELINNLVLTERTTIGMGVSDAFLPTHQRRYTRKAFHNADPWEEPSVDNLGYVTRTQYDWRMRPSRVDTFDVDAAGYANDSPAARLETTLTYYDHLDRPHTIVRYGRRNDSNVLDVTGIDPTYAFQDDAYYNNYDKTGSLVPIQDFFKADQTPLTIERMFYGPDGAVRERRMYNTQYAQEIPLPSTITYHSTWSYSGRGVASYSQSPQSAISTTQTDALGRATKTSSVVRRDSALYQLERSDSIYDADGLLADARRLERTLDQFTSNQVDVLQAVGTTQTNAARTRSVFWYDAKRRQIASGHLGTESISNTFGPVVNDVYDYPLNIASLSNRPHIEVHSGIEVVVPTALKVTGREARVGIEHYDPIIDKIILRSETIDSTIDSITAFKYYPSGRMSHQIENYSTSPTATNRRFTKYFYDNMGRLEKFEVSTGDAPTQRQITRVQYGADVMGEEGSRTASSGAYGLSYSKVSRSNSLVGKMWLPNPVTGAAPPDPALPGGSIATETDLFFRYTIDGRIAERIDARRISLQYFYDAIGRVLQVRVGHYTDAGYNAYSPGYPLNMSPIGATPVDRVAVVDYVYDNRGHLTRVSARGPPSGSASNPTPGTTLSQNIFRYDARGNLLKDVQKIDGAIANSAAEASTPTASYTWAYQPTTETNVGFDRLASITYPATSATSSNRLLNLLYGLSGGVDDQLSRIAGYSTTRVNTTPIAQFTYAGLGRRVAVTYGSAPGFAPTPNRIHADLRKPDGGTLDATVNGLDRFGQVTNLRYRNAETSPRTLFQGQYTYDLAGNRTSQRIVQADVGGLSHANRRSQLHSYDELQRLTRSQTGSAQPATGAPTAISTSEPQREDSWKLDHLGNWIGGTPAAPSGRVSSGNLDNYQVGSGFAFAGLYQTETGQYAPWPAALGSSTDAADDSLSLRHDINQQNEINLVQSRREGEATTTAIAFAYDAVGNLIDDGVVRYQYDAWNRLVSVHRRTPGSAAGTVAGTGYAGFIRGYNYDGLGRLTRAQSPYPDPDTFDPEHPGGTNRIER